MTNCISIDSAFMKNNPYLQNSVSPLSAQTNNFAHLEIPTQTTTQLPATTCRTFPQNVEYSGDIFEKQNVVSEGFIFNTKDGEKYDLQTIMSQRVFSAANSSANYKAELPWWRRIINFFKTGVSMRKIRKIENKSLEILNSMAMNTISLNEAFSRLTGAEYTDENTEKFLRGEIKLKIEQKAEKYMRKEIKIPPLEPYVSKYYVNKKMLSDMENTRRDMTEAETKKYELIRNQISPDYQIKLRNALKNGQLLQNNSDDQTTVLESLHKILTTPRAEKLDNKQILEECIEILDNPYVITQRAEDIPEEYQEECKERLYIHGLELPPYRNINTCTAASIEYYLASQHPAQFFKIVEALTSKQKTYTKVVDLDKLNGTLIPIGVESKAYKLKEFNTKYCMKDENTATVKITPDKNAYLLAEIQTKYKDEWERSIIDIIMQSTIMNLGSRNTYESISDTRKPNEYTSDHCGLVEYENNFILNILTEDSLINRTYKGINGQYVSNSYKHNDIKNEILDSLNRRGSVIAGYIWNDGIGLCGHEITIVGYTTNRNGDGFFIIQDSDDEKAQPVLIEENDFLEMLHHAFI